MIVFSRDWFAYHQSKLLRFANSRIGRYILRIHGDRSDVGGSRITRIEPHAITWIAEGKHHTEFRTHAKFSKRLYHAFKPLWHLIHAWDLGFANNLHTALNLGFDTLTKFTDGDPETNTVDGFVERDGVNETFSAIRGGAGTDASSLNSIIFVELDASTTANQYNALARGIILFDTSTIGASSTISNATVSLYGNTYYNGLGNTSLEICSSAPASNTEVSIGDYGSLGTTSFGSVAGTSYQTFVYNDFTLNASGISNIDKAGISKFGARTAWDLNNSFTGVWTSNGETGFGFSNADYSGTSRDPKITVTYTPNVTVTYATGNPYSSGKMMTYNGSTWSEVSNSDLYFSAYTTTGATTIAYSSQDPSAILRAVIDNFNDNGGTITYDGSSIANTGTTVTYTFVTQSILECINKILELAPANWYWYVNPATNLIYFKQKSGSADHMLGLGREIKSIKADKRTEGIINTVYFTGGDIGGGTKLYKKYQDTSSVGTYGIRAIRYVDERVTLAATAQTISNNIISSKSAPQVRLDLEISDSNTDGFGYDIESVDIGEVVNLQNIPGSTGKSLWDLAFWDVDKWDYSIADLGSMYLQIVRREYSPDTVKVFCSTIPPDVSKRIEDINRNLEASRTFDNPDEPQ